MPRFWVYIIAHISFNSHDQVREFSTVASMEERESTLTQAMFQAV
ncbi:MULTISPECIES: hypothetical protein [unclassified Moorena]|nr:MULTISPECIES: hypothetical protein [unclassified Moorena]